MVADKKEIIYSLEKSVNDLEEVIKNSIKNNNQNYEDIYNSLGTTLLWIGSCLDRLKSVGVKYNENEVNYERAFRGAYNAQKHSISLVSFQQYKKGGISFPIHFPLTIPAPNYYFNKLDENVINFKEQIKTYNDILSNKPIILEVKKMQQIIITKFNNL
ncbi:MAG: hypothetical protein OSJ66_07540 [Clostridia bacterium]|nr:hypothetical protein [Clostridia bacterium]